MLFHHKKIVKKPLYDVDSERPAIRASICTGEKVAGFQNLKNGSFREVMLIRNQKDLEAFCSTYRIKNDKIPTIY